MGVPKFSEKWNAHAMWALGFSPSTTRAHCCPPEPWSLGLGLAGGRAWAFPYLFIAQMLLGFGFDITRLHLDGPATESIVCG